MEGTPILCEDPAEAALIRAALAGEPGAWERLAEPNRGKVRAVVLGYIHNLDDADDMTQEILLRAYRKLGSFRGNSRFVTWLHTVAVRMCLTRLRGHTPETVELAPEWGLVDPTASNNVESVVLKRLEVEELLRRLDRIPQVLKEPILLKAVAGLTEVEIAEQLGCPLGTIKSRQFRGRQMLRAGEPGDDGNSLR